MKNADRAKTVQRPCKWRIKRKSHEGTRIPGPLIKRAYFNGFLCSELLQNTRFYGIFASLCPVAVSHAFLSCRIFVALFCGTITGTFFIHHDKQGSCSHDFGRTEIKRFSCHRKSDFGWLPCPISGCCAHQNFAGVSLAVGVGRGGNYCSIWSFYWHIYFWGIVFLNHGSMNRIRV